ESLIILSGAAPGRAWRKPVPLTDVVRAAVSEVEDYARVEVRQLAETSVAGAAVADLTHLLAEIIENAAQFSPPHTRVRVTGEPVGNGYAVEVEDRGLGMGKEALAEANRRITESEALDLFDSDRLGLFVVSRLAARHAVKVHLKTSPYGGTTAVVLLPTALLDDRAEQRPPGTPAEASAEESPEPREPARAPHPGTAHVPPRPRAVAAPDRRRALVAPVTDPPPEPSRVAHAVPRADPGVEPQSPQGAATLRLHRTEEPAGSCDLPRRVRQASLAPQLRDGRPDTPGPARGNGGDDDRTPELVRDRMTAYRDGWTRGGGRPPGASRGTARPSTEGDPA
ncbi:sensor histidine kinase, partial [Streptomyces werraensis]|uniref:sensor histidine kinase n=1 Tax=Streptomyces werraensis TaxID=68284 RepID=UPI003419ABCB